LEIKTKVNLCMVEYAGKVLEFYMEMWVDSEMMETLTLTQIRYISPYRQTEILRGGATGT
jgi:methyl coenzyme M reductase subunit D